MIKEKQVSQAIRRVLVPIVRAWNRSRAVDNCLVHVKRSQVPSVVSAWFLIVTFICSCAFKLGCAWGLVTVGWKFGQDTWRMHECNLKSPTPQQCTACVHDIIKASLHDIRRSRLPPFMPRTHLFNFAALAYSALLCPQIRSLHAKRFIAIIDLLLHHLSGFRLQQLSRHPRTPSVSVDSWGSVCVLTVELC